MCIMHVPKWHAASQPYHGVEGHCIMVTLSPQLSICYLTNAGFTPLSFLDIKTKCQTVGQRQVYNYLFCARKCSMVITCKLRCSMQQTTDILKQIVQFPFCLADQLTCELGSILTSYQIHKKEVDCVTQFLEDEWLSGYPPRICLRILPDVPTVPCGTIYYELKVSGVDDNVVFFVIPPTSFLSGTSAKNEYFSEHAETCHNKESCPCSCQYTYWPNKCNSAEWSHSYSLPTNDGLFVGPP